MEQDNARDEDIINLVNLKFIAEHYNYPPLTIMKMRQENKSFVAICDEIQQQINPDHPTGAKKQYGKMKKFIKKYKSHMHIAWK